LALAARRIDHGIEQSFEAIVYGSDKISATARGALVCSA
jgi:hypothetical protein